MAKISYILILLLGLIIIVFTVFRQQIDEAICERPIETDQRTSRPVCNGLLSSSTAIFLTASTLTMVTGMTAFFSPAQRWRELRSIAESLKSNVFEFRTRTGRFTTSLSEPRKPEMELMQAVQDARIEVVQLGGLTESSFTRMYPDSVWKHGQNRGSWKYRDTFDMTTLGGDSPIHGPDLPGFGLADNHHSPMKPGQYISARLIPMLHWYQRRVPQKYREAKLTMFLMLTCTSGIAVLSYLNGRPGMHTVDLNAVAGVVSGLSAAITAWQSDSGADRKINRYTNAVVSINNLLLWWDSLTAPEQSSLKNIDRLIHVGEHVKMVEVSGWADASRPDKDDQSTPAQGSVPKLKRQQSDASGDVIVAVENPLLQQ